MWTPNTKGSLFLLFLATQQKTLRRFIHCLLHICIHPQIVNHQIHKPWLWIWKVWIAAGRAFWLHENCNFIEWNEYKRINALLALSPSFLFFWCLFVGLSALYFIHICLDDIRPKFSLAAHFALYVCLFMCVMCGQNE